MTPDLSREIEQLKLRLKKLEMSVNQPQKSDARNTDGKSGDIRVTKDSQGMAYIEVKGDEGWYTTARGAVALKDKANNQMNLSTAFNVTNSDHVTVFKAEFDKYADTKYARWFDVNDITDIASPQNGDIASVFETAVYIRSDGAWKQISN